MIGELKQKRYENKKILKAAKDCPVCMNCGRLNQGGDIVAAHLNGIRAYEFYRGTGQKPSDSVTAFICFTCHQEFDGEREHDESGIKHSEKFLLAVARTHDWLFRNKPEIFK